jgi:hypothetical protein
VSGTSLRSRGPRLLVSGHGCARSRASVSNARARITGSIVPAAVSTVGSSVGSEHCLAAAAGGDGVFGLLVVAAVPVAGELQPGFVPLVQRGGVAAATRAPAHPVGDVVPVAALLFALGRALLVGSLAQLLLEPPLGRVRGPQLPLLAPKLDRGLLQLPLQLGPDDRPARRRLRKPGRRRRARAAFRRPRAAASAPPRQPACAADGDASQHRSQPTVNAPRTHQRRAQTLQAFQSSVPTTATRTSAWSSQTAAASSLASDG